MRKTHSSASEQYVVEYKKRKMNLLLILRYIRRSTRFSTEPKDETTSWNLRCHCLDAYLNPHKDFFNLYMRQSPLTSSKPPDCSMYTASSRSPLRKVFFISIDEVQNKTVQPSPKQISNISSSKLEKIFHSNLCHPCEWIGIYIEN